MGIDPGDEKVARLIFKLMKTKETQSVCPLMPEFTRVVMHFAEKYKGHGGWKAIQTKIEAE